MALDSARDWSEMTEVVWGNYEFDSDDVYISKNILEELELLSSALENNWVATVADDLSDLVAMLKFIEKLHDEEDAAWKESDGRPWDIGPDE